MNRCVFVFLILLTLRIRIFITYQLFLYFFLVERVQEAFFEDFSHLILDLLSSVSLHLLLAAIEVSLWLAYHHYLTRD